jgi:hypothetical protein
MMTSKLELNCQIQLMKSSSGPGRLGHLMYASYLTIALPKSGVDVGCRPRQGRGLQETGRGEQSKSREKQRWIYI